MGVQWKHRPNIEAFGAKNPSLEVAYWAGFLLADGSVRDQFPNLAVDLQRRDAPHLERLRQLACPTAELKYPSARPNVVRLEIYGRDFVNTLLRYGIVPRKSQGHPLPDVPDYAVRHFIRGYFDGDGCIGEYPLQARSSLNYKVIFTGQQAFLRWVKSKLTTAVGSGGSLYTANHKGCWQLSYGGMRQVPQILNYLDGYPRLERKWQICDLAKAGRSYCSMEIF